MARSATVLLLVLTAAPISAQTTASLVSVAGYGNFHAAGVVATIGGDTDGDATAALEWRRVGEPAFRAAHPLVRIDPTHFAGSLFWFDAGALLRGARHARRSRRRHRQPAQTAAVATRTEALPEPTLRARSTWRPAATTATPAPTWAHACATVQRAADVAQAGDLIWIAPGVYRESVDVPVSGTAAQPIVFRGAAPGAVLDGADAAIAAGVPWIANGNGVYRRSPASPPGTW